MIQSHAKKHVMWFCLFPAMAAVLALVGWTLGIEPLKSVLPGMIAMNPLSAICWLMLSPALWLRVSPGTKLRRLMSISLAFTVAVIAGLRLGSYFFGYEFHADTWLFSNSIGTNRMAPNAAACFVLISVAIATIDRVTARGFWPAQVLAIVVGTVSLVTLFGYSFGAMQMYRVGTFTPMALMTAISFGVLAFGFLHARPERGLTAIVLSSGAGGVLARRLLPSVIIVPWILGGLRLQGQRLGYYDTEFGTALLAAVTVLLFVIVVSWISAALNRSDLAQQHVEKELRKAMEKADEANKAKSEFLANMSHEIRTPMNGIIGMTELALTTSLNSDQKEYLATIKDSGDALLTVINDILDFSKVEAGKLELDEVDFNLPKKMSTTMRVLAGRAQEKGLELIVQVYPDVPKWVSGDPDRLRQIVMNLVGNAIKFTSHGEVTLTIHTESAFDDDRKKCLLHFTVGDTGIGIPPEKQQTIFDAFSQADSSTTRKFGGSGLGLTISSRLANLMGGRIWVESVMGEGSKFHFTALVNMAIERIDKSNAAHLATLAGMNVLVVDDNATNRRVLHDMLAHWKMCPSLTSSGQEALAVARAAVSRGEPFPIILVDYLMPDMDGFTLAEQIRSDPALNGASILMLTSVANHDLAVRSTKLEIAAYLRKPLSQSTLLDALVDAVADRNIEKSSPGVVNGRSDVALESESPRAPVSPLKILLAEDNRINQRVATRMLNLAGHHVTVADNGEMALAQLDASDFDVVLMDVQMPIMGGFEATANIRKGEETTGWHMPIIAMTAHALNGDRERCLAAGMDDYISKPMTSEVLQRVLAASQFPAATAYGAVKPCMAE